MKKLQPFIDAYLSGDSLFRFVYKPDTDELFLEEDLQEHDNGRFYYVPFKNSQQLYAEMSYFTDEQSSEASETLKDALTSPSPIGKFEKIVLEIGLGEKWQYRKNEFAKKHVIAWFMEQGLPIE